MEVYHVDEQDNRRSTSFDALGTTMMTSAGDRRGIWEQSMLQEMNDPSIFCTDQFSQIPDFPCMSSSSSSSSNPAKTKPISSATSTSTASSMSSSTIDCMDVMESYGYMDLIDGDDIWDPSSLFEQNPPELPPESEVVRGSVITGGDGGGGGRLDELGAVFFEWLKSNKEFISAENMRNIKIKKSTIECASKKLGSSKEGKKQLLKLILEWVQQHQLKTKNSSGGELHTSGGIAATVYPPPQAKVPPPPFNYGCPPQPWIPFPPYPPYMAGQVGSGLAIVAPPVQPPSSAFSHMGGDYDSSFNSHLNLYNNNNNTAGLGDQYQVLDSVPSWNHAQITTRVSHYPPQIMPLASGYPGQFSYKPVVYNATGGGGERRLMGLGPSATKEARKKRMARQRRTNFHHSRQHQNNNHNLIPNYSDHHPQAMQADDNCSGISQGGNWLYWPSSPSMEAPYRPSSGHDPPVDQWSNQTSSDKLNV